MNEVTTVVEQAAVVRDNRRALRRRRRRRWVAVVLVVAAAAAAGVVVWVLRSAPHAQPASGLPPTTASVVRTTLTQTESINGTLSYPQATPLANRLTGTVTSVPAPGTVVRQGQPLYSVDQLPVVLLYGPVPDYRALTVGTIGADVQQLETDLRAMGYTGFTVDDTYTDATALAVRQWQHDNGLPETGTVDLGRIVFLSGPVRVSSDSAHVGQVASPGGPLLSYTGPDRIVTADVDVTQLPLVPVGTRATVTLPGDVTVDATVTAVGSASNTTNTDQSTPTDPNSATFPVTFAIADQQRAGTVTGAPVSISVVGQRAANVLAVPVAALLALREGGYGVQVVHGTTTRIVAVRTGMFAAGLVQVSGQGITEGTVVGVASS